VSAVAEKAAGGGRRLLGQVLKSQGVVKEGQVQEALAEQRKHGGLIGQCLIQIGHCTSAHVARALAEQAWPRGRRPLAREPREGRAGARRRSTAHAYGVLPLRVEGKTLVVAIADPLNTAVLEDLRFQKGIDVRAALADAAEIKAKVLQHYGPEGTLQDAIREAARAVSGSDVQSAAKSAPVVRL
jgi:type IV pilus assembly protein PilB